MVYFKPITEKSCLRQLFPEKAIDDNAVCGAYKGLNEDGSQAGVCFVSIDGYRCAVSDLSCDISDKLLVEGFLRASLNFAANRNAYMAYCRDGRIADVLSTLGFEKNGEEYSGDIPTLLQGNCCKE